MLKKNLESLLVKYSQLEQELNKVNKDSNLEVFPARNGSMTALYKKEGKSIYIHSRYDPEKEAERFVSNLNIEGIDSIIVLGFGLGYHVKTLFNKIRDKGVKLFVIIEDLYLFKRALSYNDFTDLFTYEKFYLILFEDPEKTELSYIIQSKIDHIFEKIQLIELPFINNLELENIDHIREELQYILYTQLANNATVTERGAEWEKNILGNLALLLRKPGVGYVQDCFKDKTAIIVAAGPSLNKNIHLLKKAKGKAIIIAVDAVLKRLLAEDIIPDIVVVYDGYKYTLKYFEGLDYSKLNDVILLSSHLFYNHVLEEWPGPLLFAPVVGIADDLLYWVEKTSDYKGRISTGGSVAHLAFMFAWQLKANPIVLVGQDLAFTDDTTHVSGSAYHRNIDEEMRRSNKLFLKIKDIHGNDVWTRNDFYYYLVWFNRMISGLKNIDKDKIFIDATEGGARIEGTELMSLEEVINVYCQEEIDTVEELLVKICSYKPVFSEEIIKEINKEVDS
ncbi:MAG: 6-hydroxymethylpterin diphosphokinase MptE-like protein, partial [Halanaerobiales bacterium]